jgi:hypothetical protein
VTADDDDLARITRRVSARGLSIHDVAEVVGSQLKKQRHELIEHMERRLRLLQINGPRDETRFLNLNRRLTRLESDLRLLMRKGHLP